MRSYFYLTLKDKFSIIGFGVQAKLMQSNKVILKKVCLVVMK